MAAALGRDGDLDYRSILEASDPTIQCGTAIKPFTQGTRCYLCGVAIVSTGTKATDEMHQECEHIMPLVQARWYNLAYYPKRATVTGDAIALEYAWAHRCCNQAKKSELFISYPLADGSVTVQENVVQLTLDSIKQRARKAGLQAIVDAISTGTRKDIIINEKVKPLVEWINKIPHTVPDSSALLQLAGAASLVDPATRKPKLRELEETLFLTQEELARIENDKEDAAFVGQYVEKVIAERVADEEAAESLVALGSQSIRVRRVSVIESQNKTAEASHATLKKMLTKGLAASAAEDARALATLMRMNTSAGRKTRRGKKLRRKTNRRRKTTTPS